METHASSENVPSFFYRMSRTRTRVLWISFSLLCLVVFTWMKLPRDQLNAYLITQLHASLAQQGMVLKAEETRLSFFLGMKYQFKKGTISFPTFSQKGHFDSMTLS